ncbi:MAG: ShlB/FhaC/HecB family hemolysin secretion/activation protein, partial [Burkholderiaceae bacterium]|nr:ShlB/FhaC/HecB family hemolysin secretion/activation protein [Burkholderiaceae bacterium]
TLEARWRVAQAAWARPNQLYLIAFVDAGTVEANKRPWDAGTNRRTLSGAGVGVNWTVANDLVVRAYYARKLGNEAATSAPDKSGRFWIQAVKYF